MEISATSSATSSAVQQQLAAARQVEVKPAERSRENDAANKLGETQVRTQQIQQSQARQQVQEAQRTASQQSEQPKPVVNAQGQKIGSIINTTS
jgi:hypothetical protein